MDGLFRFHSSADALRRSVVLLWRRPRVWLGALAAVVVLLAACRTGLIPVALTRAETGKLVAAADLDAERAPLYQPRIVPDVADPPPPPSSIPQDAPTADRAASQSQVERPSEAVVESPTEPPTELPSEPPMTPFRPVPATAPVDRGDVVVTAADPPTAAPVPVPPRVPPSSPSSVTPSLAASAVWPRLRGDGPVRAVAVVFLGVDCPTSAATLPRLARIHATWGEVGVRLVGIVVGPQMTPAAATEFRTVHRLRFPVMTDRSGALRQLLTPTHTPQVFVLRPSGEVAYRGRIDDDGLPPEQLEHAPPRVHLADALAAVAAGRSPPVHRTTPVGQPLPPHDGASQSAPVSLGGRGWSGRSE